jgi:hypothetical protein
MVSESYVYDVVVRVVSVSLWFKSVTFTTLNTCDPMSASSFLKWCYRGVREVLQLL